MTAIPAPLAMFTGHDGKTHRIGYLNAKNNAGQLLCDEYEGHGLRLLCLLPYRDGELEPERRNGDSFVSSVKAQAQAVIREYQVDASCTDRPLCRLVRPEEIAEKARSLALGVR